MFITPAKFNIKKTALNKSFFILFIFVILLQISFAQNVKNNQKVEEDDIIENQPAITILSGDHFKAISVAYEEFKAETLIPEEKRKIENYRILVKQNKAKILISFVANRAKGEEDLVGGSTSLGKSVYYILDKKNLEVLERYFAR